VTKTVKDQIIEQVDRLDVPRQRKVLDFARGLTERFGAPGRHLSRFAGSIDSADLEAMSQAIQEGCETVESNAWWKLYCSRTLINATSLRW
jgi:hypothetical protein